MFLNSKLSLAVCAAIASAAAVNTFAQQQDEESTIEEVVVTGIRGSLSRSIDLKRNSDLVSDSISAEDMGKFPDNNIADSLQRLPGVAIDRAGGEGRFVSIRGLGPDFTAVMINGRTAASEHEERAFSFDTIAAELVQKVDVYKSSSPSLKEGGLGGLVNIETARPFDFDGFHVAGSIKGLYEENSGDTSPQASMIVSNTFNEGRVGILGSLTYQKRSATLYSVRNDQITNTDDEPFLTLFDPPDWDGGYAYSGDGLEEDTWRIQSVNPGVIHQERERIGGNLAVQVRPVDSVVVTLDYIYSKYDTSSVRYWGGSYLWAPTLSSHNRVDENNFYEVINHGYDDGYGLTGYAHGLETTERPTVSGVGGINVQWDINDDLKMVADISQSTAVMDNRGLDGSYVLEILNKPGYILTSTGGIPQFQYADKDAVSANEANMADLRARQTSDFGVYVDAKNREAKLDFVWDVSELSSLKFGVNHTEAKKSSEWWDTPTEVKRLYQKFAERTEIDYNSIITGVINPGNHFGGLDVGIYKIDPVAYRNWMAANVDNRDGANTPGGIEAKNAFIANGSSWDAVKSGSSFDIQEDISSAYLEGKTTFFDDTMPLTISGGIRYTKTELVSSGTSQVLVSLTPENQEPGQPPSPTLIKGFANDADILVARENSYENWLPSLTAKLDLTDDIVIRLAASETLSRPTLSALAPQFFYGTTTVNTRSANGGNPNLKPFTSRNLDLSFEYYYGESNLFAVAAFRKEVDNFIVSRMAPEVLSGISVSNPEWLTFQVNRPRNGPTATVEGIEFNWTHILDNGYGLSANYTFADSNADLHKQRVEDETFALPGISDTGNLTVFYDDGILQVRLAYNYRAEFLKSVFFGSFNEPVYADSYESIDLSASYKVSNNITVFLEGYNLTNETVRTYGRHRNQFISYEDTGTLYTLGVRAKF